jgi:hypothetical protein
MACLLLLLLVPFLSAAVKTYHVNPTGSSLPSCGEVATPCSSIAAACSAIAANNSEAVVIKLSVGTHTSEGNRNLKAIGDQITAPPAAVCGVGGGITFVGSVVELPKIGSVVDLMQVRATRF